jgi:hypothetical protein
MRQILEDALKKSHVLLTKIFEELKRKNQALELRRERFVKIIQDLDDKFKTEQAKTRSTSSSLNDSEVVKLNIGGALIDIKRDAIRSNNLGWNLFSVLLSGRWDEILLKDSNGRIFLDFDSAWIDPIINLLRDEDNNLPFPILQEDFVSQENRLGFESALLYFNVKSRYGYEKLSLTEASSIACMHNNRFLEPLQGWLFDAIYDQQNASYEDKNFELKVRACIIKLSTLVLC